MYVSSGNIENTFLKNWNKQLGGGDQNIDPNYLNLPQKLILKIQNSSDDDDKDDDNNNNIMEMADFFIF